MDDCIIFQDGVEPFIRKVPRCATSVEVRDPVTGEREVFRFHVVMKGRMTAQPQRFLYAGRGEADPFDSWDVWQFIRELGPEPLPAT